MDGWCREEVEGLCMIKWICAKLAECFNAHLTEHELAVKEATEELREAIKVYEEKRKRLVALTPNDTVWIYTNQYNKNDFHSARYFSLGKVEVRINRSKIV